jgi:hypothetical protein
MIHFTVPSWKFLLQQQYNQRQHKPQWMLFFILFGSEEHSECTPQRLYLNTQYYVVSSTSIHNQLFTGNTSTVELSKKGRNTKTSVDCFTSLGKYRSGPGDCWNTIVPSDVYARAAAIRMERYAHNHTALSYTAICVHDSSMAPCFGYRCLVSACTSLQEDYIAIIIL